jgi:N-acetylglucosaminyl-diphospho-decaprenol L-rhamnosyltransferase
VLSIVIVTYNSGRYLGACLRSLAGPGDVMVVDNASADGSAEVARNNGVRVIANSENRGFAAAANQGAREATSDLILFLNPDTVLLQGLDVLESTVRERPDVAGGAGLLVDEDGSPQQGFSVRRLPTFWSLAFEVLGLNRLWPSNRVNRHYRCVGLTLTEPVEVEQPAGACLLIRKSVWERLGGFDERFYPLWYEDVDFCWRLRKAGEKLVLEPRCRFLHKGGHSLENIAFEERQLFWYRNMLYYIEKNLGYVAALAMRVLVFAGASARMTIALLVGKPIQRGAFRTVISLAFSRDRK